ncbi:hypothetical protein [Lentzea sp. NPDC003310]|uniref:hypothetical protein n=1 Tax=Lentzea sp. NPDC003310 TaxID=3154447 RepID=UPI0033ABFD48
MSEQEIREGMLLAVWDEPPLDFDPDTLIRRVEQKKSRRRALVAVGVATAVIAVASFSLPGLLPRDRDAQLGTETQTTTSAPSSSAESAERRALVAGDRMSATLSARMPDLTGVYATFTPGRHPAYPPSQAKSEDWAPGNVEFAGFVHLSDRIGPTALQVSVARKSFSKDTFCSGASLCQEIKQGDGSVLFAVEHFHDSQQIQKSSVVREFESGLVVEISAYAFNPSNGNGQRETVPVRVGVLTQLITDPGIAWQ